VNIEERFIELRVAYPGHPYVAVLGPGCLTGKLKKLKCPFYSRRERLADGSQQQVYLLPDHDLTYEIEEVVAGQPTRWYAATLAGDPNLYRISEYGAKVYARREMTLRDVLREHPERPSLADFRDWEG
jgi:hypothetical protein